MQGPQAWPGSLLSEGMQLPWGYPCRGHSAGSLQLWPPTLSLNVTTDNSSFNSHFTSYLFSVSFKSISSRRQGFLSVLFRAVFPVIRTGLAIPWVLMAAGRVNE